MPKVKAIPYIQELGLPFSACDAFLRIHGQPWSFFLDSGTVDGRLGHYSFMGCDPFLVFRSSGDLIDVAYRGDLTVQRGNPFEALKSAFNRFRLFSVPDLPPFQGGAVGYFGYDLGHFVEKLPARARHDVSVPDCCVAFYDVVVLVDHLSGQAWIASSGFPEEKATLRQKRAISRIKDMSQLLSGEPPSPEDLPVGEAVSSPTFTSNFTRKECTRAIEKAKGYIAAGEIYQVNLSQRFCCELGVPPFSLYRMLRSINPAPFAGYLGFDGVAVVSSSPERFLRISGREVETRPIKGTRPRGSSPDSDEKLKRELWESPKDRAELVMIVDLERNDLGRVCEYGTVRVPELITLEPYATVFHLVSTVRGRLREDKDHIDCLKACFPGGSITGAPKIRAMEIIDELEPTRRTVYTGSMGYLGFNQETDLNIVIRTVLSAGNRLYFQAGGGIVADSDPELEYEETLHKARALMEALRGAASYRVFKGYKAKGRGL